MTEILQENGETGLEIAVIGMAGCWQPFTTKTARVYQGFGPHMGMLYPGFGFTQKNAGVICEILAKIKKRRYQNEKR